MEPPSVGTMKSIGRRTPVAAILDEARRTNGLAAVGGCYKCVFAKDLPIRRLAEADQQRPTHAQRRRLEIAGRPQQLSRQRVIVRRRLLHVEDDDFFAFARDNLVGRFGKPQRLVAADSGSSSRPPLLAPGVAAFASRNP